MDGPVNTAMTASMVAFMDTSMIGPMIDHGRSPMDGPMNASIETAMNK